MHSIEIQRKQHRSTHINAKQPKGNLGFGLLLNLFENLSTNAIWKEELVKNSRQIIFISSIS